MQLEQIVTSLEVSKKLDVALKKANIKVEPLFSWSYSEDNDRYTVDRTRQLWKDSSDDIYPALTASEIGEILPKWIKKDTHIKKKDDLFLRIEKNDNNIWLAEYLISNMDNKVDIRFFDKKLSDALGEMLCYLIDNGLLKDY